MLSKLYFNSLTALNMKLLLCIVLFLNLKTILSQDPTLLSQFDNFEELTTGYELYWSVDSADNASFAVRVETTGWVAFGISPNGMMPGSDIAFAWVDGGSVAFSVSWLIIVYVHI